MSDNPEYIESTSPIVDRAMELGEAQTRPMQMSVMDQLKQRKPAPDKPQVIMEGTRKGPGRPRTTPADTDDEKEAKRREAASRAADTKKRIRKVKTDEYTQKILDEGNEYILSILIGQGVPASAVYQSGMAPVTVVNSRYTEFGNQMVLKPMQARAIAGFMADLEASDTGTKVTNVFAGSTVGLVLKGLAAGAAIASYAKGLYQVQQRLAPMLAQAEAYKQAKAAEQTAQSQQNMGVM